MPLVLRSTLFSEVTLNSLPRDLIIHVVTVTLN